VTYATLTWRVLPEGGERVKLSKRERKRLAQALWLAMECQESAIDAHHIQYAKRRKGGQHYMIVPDEYKKTVARWRRDVKAFARLLTRMVKGGK